MSMAHASLPTAAEQLDGLLNHGEEVDQEDVRALDAVIDESDAELECGEGIPLVVVIAEMRRNLRVGG
jgi:hypothetical protein